MPDLPSMLLPEFEQLTHQYSDVKNLPRPESIQHIDVLEGSPQPILRFGVLDTFDWKLEESVCAEIEFSYAGGRIKAGTSGDSFIGEQHGKWCDSFGTSFRNNSQSSVYSCWSNH